MSSFHGDTVLATVEELKSVCYTYLDSNDGEDKVNFDFKFYLPNGKEFWVYDWKQYRVIQPNEYINFHIGAGTPEESLEAYKQVIKLLNKKKMTKLKRCTISGVVDFEKNFYKNGKYPYATFVENFRAKHSIPVEELRSFCEKIKDMRDLELEKLLN